MNHFLKLSSEEVRALKLLALIWLFDFLAIICLTFSLAILYPNTILFLIIALSLPLSSAIERFYKSSGKGCILNALSAEFSMLERKRESSRLVGFFLSINTKIYFSFYVISLIYISCIPFLRQDADVLFVLCGLIPTAVLSFSAGFKMRDIIQKHLK